MARIRAGVGLSQEADTTRAATEAAAEAMAKAGLERAAWALCFFSGHHIAEGEALRGAVVRKTGAQALAGCSAMGVIGGNREIEDGPAVVVLVAEGSGLAARSALAPLGSEELASLCGPPAGEPPARIVVALPDTYQVNTEQLRERFAAELPHIQLAGAGATDHAGQGVSLQLGVEEVRPNALSLLGLYGDYEFSVGITQSCVPVGEPHFITASHDNVLEQMDGRPALHSLIEQGQALHIESFGQVAREILFGFPLDPEAPQFSGETCLVRHLIGLDQDTQGLVIAHPLENQGAVGFMHRNPARAEEDMGRMVAEAAAKLSGPPELGLYFDCAARGRNLYGRAEVDARKIRDLLGDFPLIGMFGGFELATAMGTPQVFTYTGVLVLLRGRG